VIFAKKDSHVLLDFISRLSGWLNYRLARFFAQYTCNTRLKRIRPQKILVMCYGNIYRSPFVEYYLKQLPQEGLSLQIKSAGFHENENRQSAQAHITYCKKWAVDLSDHRSKKVNNSLLDWADIVVIMDGHNYKMLKMLDPLATSKLIWLGSISNKTPSEISDPYGKSEETYREVINQLAVASREMIEKIKFYSKQTNQ